MAEIPPDWLKNHLAKQNGEKKTGHRWTPGMPSPNPSGRPKGIVDKRMRIRQALTDDAEAIINVVKGAAREGDIQAAALILSRVAPAIKSESDRVSFDFDPDASVADQAQQIIVAVAAGEIGIDTAKELLNLLSAFVGLRDVETFLTELRRLKDAKATHPIRGGVLIDEGLHNGSGAT